MCVGLSHCARVTDHVCWFISLCRPKWLRRNRTHHGLSSYEHGSSTLRRRSSEPARGIDQIEIGCHQPNDIIIVNVSIENIFHFGAIISGELQVRVLVV